MKEFEGHCAGDLTIQMTFGFVCFGVQRAFVAQSLFQEVGKALKETFGFGIFKHFVSWQIGGLTQGLAHALPLRDTCQAVSQPPDFDFY